MKTKCTGMEYCAQGKCAPTLDELAEALAWFFERGVEGVNRERGKETITLYEEKDGDCSTWEYEVDCRPVWTRVHLADPVVRGQTWRHHNWEPGAKGAMTFEGDAEQLVAELRRRGATKTLVFEDKYQVIAYFGEDRFQRREEIWEMGL